MWHVRHVYVAFRAQTTLHELGLLDLFPYLAMGLSGEQLQMVQNHPGVQLPPIVRRSFGKRLSSPGTSF
jgi:hypothetical protein